jgi:hemicentin
MVFELPFTVGKDMRLLSTLASSFYWTTAQEIGGAVNGYTLTDGNFRREAQIEFATGE